MMHHGPRQSLYLPSSAAQQSSILASLQSCVAFTHRSVEFLSESTDILSHATEDFPRLKVVLSNQRHYDLVSERDIQQARTHISSEVLPHINQLVSLASSELEKLERKAQALRNKTAAQEARLASLTETKSLEGREAEAARRRLAAPPQQQQQQRSADEEAIKRERRKLAERKSKRMALMRLVERAENGEDVGDEAGQENEDEDEEEEEL